MEAKTQQRKRSELLTSNDSDHCGQSIRTQEAATTAAKTDKVTTVFKANESALYAYVLIHEYVSV
jgi:hypothetical protein